MPSTIPLAFFFRLLRVLSQICPLGPQRLLRNKLFLLLVSSLSTDSSMWTLFL